LRGEPRNGPSTQLTETPPDSRLRFAIVIGVIVLMLAGGLVVGGIYLYPQLFGSGSETQATTETVPISNAASSATGSDAASDPGTPAATDSDGETARSQLPTKTDEAPPAGTPTGAPAAVAKTAVTQSDQAKAEAARPAVAKPPPPEREVAQIPVAKTQPAGPEVVDTEIQLVRPTTGTLNCDNTRIEKLDGLAVGARLDFQCRNFLIIDARDGGALRLTIRGAPAVAAGPDGQPLVAHTITPPTAEGGS
jgi:hypothetical protein